MNNFRTINRDTAFLLPPSVDEWLPERHLARFIVEVIDRLDLSKLVQEYRGSGSASYHPSMLLGLLVYGSSYDSVAFRFIAGNEHPDHDDRCVSAAFYSAHRTAVRGSAAVCPRDGCAEAWHGGLGWHEDSPH